jgi:hypothetical protein
MSSSNGDATEAVQDYSECRRSREHWNSCFPGSNPLRICHRNSGRNHNRIHTNQVIRIVTGLHINAYRLQSCGSPRLLDIATGYANSTRSQNPGNPGHASTANSHYVY